MDMFANSHNEVNVGDQVTLKNNGLRGIVKDTVTDLCMVELENGCIDAYYLRQLEF